MFGWLVDCFWDPIRQLVLESGSHVVACEDRVMALAAEVGELRSKRADLQNKVDRDRRQGKEPSENVKWLLSQSKELHDEAVSMEARYKKMSKCVGGIPTNVFLGYHLSSRAEKMVPAVKELKSNRAFGEAIGVRSGSTGFVERIVSLTDGEKVKSVLEQLQRHVEDENVRLVGLYGMGGVGKTGLLEELYNQLSKMAELKYVIWVDMPSDSNVREVQRAVTQYLDIDWDAHAAEKDRARLITRELSRWKFVLILDGLWKPLPLAEVGIPIRKRPSGSEVIIATRIEENCGQMEVDVKVCVRPMEWDEDWKLFADKAGGEANQLINSDKEIRKLAKDLVGKCGGLPMALASLGRAMSTRKTREQWEHAATVMDVAPWDLLGEEIFLRLKSSYDNLPNDKLRTCFLYCSLYPEGSSIYKEWIIDYCIGEGIIDQVFVDLDELYGQGHELLRLLQSLSLLENGDGENDIKMHPLVRGLALWIACDCGKKANEWLVRPQAQLHEAPQADKWRSAERVCLMRNKIQAITEIPECPNVQTLLLQRNLNLETICDGFFTHMTKLRVLDLSHNRIRKLPSGIEVLTDLRYLDLCNTNLKSLPPELGKLKKLRFLLLSYMSFLRTIPDQVISSLSELQVLYMHCSYGDWKVGSVGGGVDFDELNRLKRLTTLGITILTVPALQSLVQSPRLAERTRRLHVRACPGLPTIDMPPTIFGRSMKKLEWLRLSDSDELKEVAIRGDCDDAVWSQLLPKLQTLNLCRLGKAKIVWYGGCFLNLSNLYIWNCRGLEHLVYCRDDDHDNDDHEVQVAEYDGRDAPSQVVDAFPNLKVIQLIGVPDLKSLIQGRRMVAFPSLEELTVLRCTKLKTIEMKADKLREIQGEKQWWQGLEWEDESLKSHFQLLFHQGSKLQ